MLSTNMMSEPNIFLFFTKQQDYKKEFFFAETAIHGGYNTVRAYNWGIGENKILRCISAKQFLLIACSDLHRYIKYYIIL